MIIQRCFVHTYNFLRNDLNYVKYELHNYIKCKNNACIFYEIILHNSLKLLILHMFKLFGKNLCVENQKGSIAVYKVWR